jgi:hypothetical protein
VNFHFTPITGKLYEGSINFDGDISNTDIIRALDTKYGKPKVSEENLSPMGALGKVKKLLYKDTVCETRNISVSFMEVLLGFSTDIDYFIASPKLKEALEKECKKRAMDWEEEKSRTFKEKLKKYEDKL